MDRKTSRLCLVFSLVTIVAASATLAQDIGLGGSGTRVIQALSGELALGSTDGDMRFAVDTDIPTCPPACSLTWSYDFFWGWDNTWDNSNLMMHLGYSQLPSMGGGYAQTKELRLRGTVVPDAFDLAESFLKKENLEPGDLVSVDTSRPDAVRRSARAYEKQVIGVVSTKPTVLMGGAAFTVEHLRELWGDEIATSFERKRADIESKLYAVDDDLSAALHNLKSAADSEQKKKELFLHEQQMELRALEEFLRQNFVSVALAGRVPVKVLASSGPIAAGDLLTASPLPGYAMKAIEPGPVIGTALEPLPGGSQLIMALIHRGWYGGDSAHKSTTTG